MKILQTLLDWLYPPKCISCRILLPLQNPARFICAYCVPLFDPIPSPLCPKCGTSVQSETRACSSCLGKAFHFSKNTAAFPYDDLVRDLMHEIKFRKRKRVAQGIGELWANTIRKDCFLKDAILVPLPMHRSKQRERGFNQAEILALELAKKHSVPAERVLIRTADTPPQAGLHPRLRAENVRDAFAIAPGHSPEGKNYILIDDIYTTGASLNECAGVLKKSGAKSVSSMTFAITIKNINKG